MKYVLPSAETERLKFRLLEPSDRDTWLALFKQTEILRFFGMDESIPPEEHCQNWMNKIAHRYENDLGGLNVLIEKETGAFVGQCGLLVQTVEGEEYLEIGYSILPQFWGKGYATEAAKKCKEEAFRQNFTDLVISIIHPENIRSEKVARKNGMKIIRTVPEYLGMTINMFGITREEWERSQLSGQNSR